MPYDVTSLALMTFCVFMIGMTKGGLPLGGVAVSLMILIWPDQAEAARTSVAFLLPVLCAMDVVAVIMYRGHIRWRLLWPILPWELAGIALASVLFVSQHDALIQVSDRGLKVCIGVLGLLFVGYQAFKRLILRRLEAHGVAATRTELAALGIGAGLASTIAHQAGPIAQMYLLPRRLPKLEFAGTNAMFFLLLNFIKLIPFAVLGRLDAATLKLGAAMLPVVPVGVLAGYGLVRVLKPAHYTGIIYGALTITSVLLIGKGLSGG